MPNTNSQIKKTMEDMLVAEGYVAKISITKDGFVAKLPMSLSGEMTLKYPHSLTPGEVVFEIRRIFNAINGKIEDTRPTA